jgi:16S rRNA (cytosine967-C5)-methyltransferase
MLPFREFHLVSLLEGFEKTTLPLDLFVSIYFKEHKALGSKDRAQISDQVFALIRYKGLLDALASNQNWVDRLQLFKKLEPISEKRFTHLAPFYEVSFPKELFELFEENFGLEKAKDICRICNTKAPTTVRVNTKKISRQDMLKKWSENYQVRPTLLSPNGIIFIEKTHFYSMPEFKDGLFEIQDEASQLVSYLIKVKESDLVLDYCAGAGGKSLAIAPNMHGKGQIFLHDIRKKALIDAKERLKRAGIQNYQIVFSDEASKLKKLKKLMDWVLVDSPCSGTGTLRRNPDMKWRFKKEALTSLIGEQRNVFEKALSFLKKDGHIVYATCSMLKEENEEQVNHFIKTYNLEIVETFKSLPSLNGMDGFYAACLKRVV